VCHTGVRTAIVGLQLEEAISRLEAENRQRRRQQLEKTFLRKRVSLRNPFSGLSISCLD
jgi:hypothetical protein